MSIQTTGWKSNSLVRVFAGVARGRRSNRLKCALLQCRGEGWQLRVTSAEAITCPAPTDDQHWNSVIKQSLSALADQADMPLTAIDALGLGDVTRDPVQLGHELTESTGITVVCRFSERDRSVGGRGRPLAPAADWLFFRSQQRDRVHVELGPSIQVTYFPRGGRPSDAHCFDAAPGMTFLDKLAQELSQGKYDRDPSGHFAVQGRHSEALIGQWNSHPFLVQSAPRYIEAGDFDDSFVQSSLLYARENRLSGKDVLCSANHFLARSLADAIRRFLPSEAENAEVITSGGGLHNGLLRKLVEDAVPGVTQKCVDDFCIPSDVLGAGRIALFSYLAMENLPGNIPRVTGARAERVLGTVIPGSAMNWDRWICNLADRFEWESRRAA